MALPYPVFPTAYLPPLAMVAAMMRQDTLVVEGQETFPKQTLRNRTVIVTADGTMTLSVPVLRPQGNHTRTADIGVCYHEPWNRTHLRAIEAAYNASPYYMYYREELELLLTRRYERLVELNEAMLAFVWQKLKLPLNLKYTEAYVRPEETTADYRMRYDYKRPGAVVSLPHYTQVFADRLPFNGNVGILDLLFNLGPESRDYLERLIVDK